MCLKLWFQSDWNFCNIIESRWFLKLTVQTQSSEQSLPKVDLKEVTVQKSFEELWTVILNKMISITFPTRVLVKLTKTYTCMKSYQLISIGRPSLLNKKINVIWFLLMFVDLVRVWSWHIISRKHPNMLLLIMSILVICK